MVQLKSFKYLEGGESEPSSRESAEPTSSDSNVSAAQKGESSGAGGGEEETKEEMSQKWRSPASSATSSMIGGNLTSDNSSQTSANGNSTRQPNQSSLTSPEECQSVRVSMGDDDEGEEQEQEKVRSKGEEETKAEDGPSGPCEPQTTSSKLETNVTKIEIEHPKADLSKRQLRPLMARSSQEIVLNQQAPKTPLTPRLKLHMPRSQTSPSPLSQMALGRSPKLTRGIGHVMPAAIAGSPLMGVKRVPSSGDNMSQYSYVMQQKGNQFEIRWHNVKLYARPKSRLPRLLTDSFIFKAFFGSSSSSSSSSGETDGSASCGDLSRSSPPLQHKIPPTIDEGLEMRMSSLDEAEQPPDSQSSDANAKQLEQQNNAAPTATNNSSDRTARNDFSKLDTKERHGESESNTAQKTRCILNNVSGQVFSGQMTAILGPSGVGKTTLLNSLTGRNTLDGTGRVSLIGASDSKRMSVVTVPQMDVLPERLTVMEDLQFTSRLKNPQAKFDHDRNIARIVKCLHMEKFLHTRIQKLSGGEARRLSIGRELLNSPNILILDEPTSGLDANTCKKIITALRDIVEHSDNILDKPMSIIITIHQPQQEVYNIFHRVYVMAMGGRVVYEGPPQMLLATLIEHSSLSRVRPTNELNENPAIVAIEVASGEFGPQIIDELAAYHENQVYEEFVVCNPGASAGIGSNDSPLNTPASLRRPHKSPLSVSRFDMSLHRKRLNSFDSSIGRPTPIMAKRQLAAGLAAQMDRMSSMTSLSYASTYDADLPESVSKLKVDKRLRRSVVMKSDFVSQTSTLVKRCWLLTKRDTFLMSIRIIGFLMVAAGTVQIFSNALDPEEHQCPQFESEVDDMYEYMSQLKRRLVSLLDILRQGNSTHLFFFHLLLCITMVTSALTGLVFPLQMRMFIREYKNGWYSPASFIMSQTIAELPADMIGPILTLLITYPLCHQPDSMYYWRELAYALVLVACCMICKSQAQIVGAFLMDSVENSVFISCVCVTGPALLSGIPIRIEQMIAPMQWISYGSFLRYSFESLLALRYGYGMCPCDPELVNGYPVVASARAIPPHLENLAVGLLAINQPNNYTLANETALAGANDLTSATNTALAIGGERENLFLRFIRLITDASNLFISGAEIGDCKNYRSLYLIGMNIPGDVFSNWIPVMLLMFVISRFITYFAVKTVIKLRRS